MMKPALRLAMAGWAAALAALCVTPAQAGPVLDGIRARGHLVCGVNPGLPGFSMADATGRWSGLDVDMCRAMAAAVLGDGQKAKFVPLEVAHRFAALQSGEVDVLSRNTTFSLARDASMGLHQTVVTYYDGQAFMVPAASKVRRIEQLKGATVCVQPGTTTEKNLADYARVHALEIKTLRFEKVETSMGAYFAGRCGAYSSDASALAAMRSRAPGGGASHVILPGMISKEPLGPLVRRGDDEWFAVVKWVVYGLIEAEEQGVTQANVERLKSSAGSSPAILRMLGASEDMGKLLGLDRDWLANALLATGNYGEIFERNVGQGSQLALQRGLNRLWSRGGLMYAMPIR